MNREIPTASGSSTVFQRHPLWSATVYYIVFLSGALVIATTFGASPLPLGFSPSVFFLAVYPAIGALFVAGLMYHLCSALRTDVLDRFSRMFAGVSLLLLVYYVALAIFDLAVIVYGFAHMH